MTAARRWPTHATMSLHRKQRHEPPLAEIGHHRHPFRRCGYENPREGECTRDAVDG